MKVIIRTMLCFLFGLFIGYTISNLNKTIYTEEQDNTSFFNNQMTATVYGAELNICQLNTNNKCGLDVYRFRDNRTLFIVAKKD